MDTIRKSIFVKGITSGLAFTDVFVVDSIEQGSRKSGDTYFTLALSDATGSVPAKFWETSLDDAIKPGAYVKVEAKGREYRGKVEINVSKIRALRPESECIALEDFVPVGPEDRFGQLYRMIEIFRGIESKPLSVLALSFLEHPLYSGLFRDSPAAKKLHQPYIGGLIEHTTRLMLLADEAARFYDVDKDVLYTAILFHDSGKIAELSHNPSIQYTRHGILIGHVGISMQIIQEFKPKFWAAVESEDKELMETKLLHVEHIVASHHGNKEWGAIQTPMSREACLFHYLDCIDARMGEFDIAAKDGTDEFRGRMRSNNQPGWFPKQ